MRTNCKHPILLVRSDAINHISTSVVYVKVDGSTKLIPIKSVEKHISLSARLHFPKYRQLIESNYEQDVKYWHDVVEHIADTTFLLTANGEEIPLYFIAPCGKCELCRNTRVGDWKQRIFLESQAYSLPPLFVTITYDDEHNSGNLNKDHIQHFLKRLRINLKRSQYKFDREFLYDYSKEAPWNVPDYFPNDDDKLTSIRYFIAGEYGSKTKRPHYHMLIWNYPIIRDNHDCIDRVATIGFMKDKIVQSWQHGDFGFAYIQSNGTHGKNLDIQYANNAGSYICKYMLKDKQNLIGRTPEFTSKSMSLGYYHTTPQLNEMISKFTDRDDISSIKVADKFGVSFIDAYCYKSFSDRFINLTETDKTLRKNVEYILSEFAQRRAWLQEFIANGKRSPIEVVSKTTLDQCVAQEYVLNIWMNRILETFQPIFSEIYHFTCQDEWSNHITIYDALQSVESFATKETRYEIIFQMVHNKDYFNLVTQRISLKNRKLKNRMQAEEKDLYSKIKDINIKHDKQKSKEIF